METINGILMFIFFTASALMVIIGIMSCETLISELETSPTINSDYSFMNNIDSYLIADTLKGGHYIDIKIKQDKDCTITKRIEAKTFEKLMRKARVWYLENK